LGFDGISRKLIVEQIRSAVLYPDQWLLHARDELALGIVKADVRTGLRDTSVPGIGHEAVEINRPPVGRTTDLYAAQVKITSECWCCPTTCLHIRVPGDGRKKL
jgi:hypothetical protein